MDDIDVLVVGSGHNALVCATMLAREERRVHVLEARGVIGGATRTETCFEKAPNLKASTGSYLLGLMPPELMERLELDLALLRRDPHYFLPTTGEKYLLFGSDREATKRGFLEFFSAKDWEADERLQAELRAFREDVGPNWLEAPLSIEETAERYVRPALKEVFVDLCRGTAADYLARFDFESDLIRAMYAVTDGFSGLHGGWDTPGTGMNFLVHSMCRLPHADGTWMVVEGGMGTVARVLERAAREAGVTFETDAPVARVDVEEGVARGVTLEDGRSVRASCVVFGADPFKLKQMAPLSPELGAKIDGFYKTGTTFKVMLALSELPRFTCLPEDRGQHKGTIHLLPDEEVILDTVREAFTDVQAGRLPDFPTIEMYIHTTIDPSFSDAQGRHSGALFVQWVPHTLAESTWEAEESRYVEHLLSICERFAPGMRDLVVDTFPLHPQKLERYFGLSGGHIHHVDNTFGYTDRMPYETGIGGLFACSAGCHPAGSVIGAAGHNAARTILDA